MTRFNQKIGLKETEFIGTLKNIFTFDVLYSGWECDGVGWIKEDPVTHKRYIILTNHGSPYIATIDELTGKIKDYIETINDTVRAIDYMTEKQSEAGIYEYS